MSNQTFYSFKGTILNRLDKNFIIAIWPDIPFYLALPKECENFMKKIVSPQFQYKEIEEDLTYNKNKIVFDYLMDNKILSILPQPTNTIVPDNPMDLHYISLQVTDKCNLRCRHCYASAGENIFNNDLSTEQLETIIENAASFSDTKGCNFIITGGEPFVRKDILHIIKFIMSKFDHVVVVTNGLLLSENIIKELSQIKNLALQVSLDGARKETHENIRGKGTYDKLINNIKTLIKYNIKVALSPLCSEKFFEEVDEYFELAKSLNVHTVQLQPVQYYGRALKNKDIQRVDGKKLINKIVEYYFSEDYGSLVSHGLESKSAIHVRNLNYLTSCGTGHGTMYIKSNGDIFSCPNMIHERYRIGNGLNDDIKDLYYNSPIYKEIRSLNVDKDFGGECANCEVKHFCGGGCRGVCIANGGTLHGKAVECGSLRSYFNEILWSVCENKDFFKKESEEWLNYKLQSV